MAIPKKGSRLIVVDDTTYRWLIRRKATYMQADIWNWLASCGHSICRGAKIYLNRTYR